MALVRISSQTGLVLPEDQALFRDGEDPMNFLSAGSLVADRRLYLSAAGAVVEEGDPNRASLLAAPGAIIPGYLVQQYGLRMEGGRIAFGASAGQPAAESPAEAAESPASTPEAPAADRNAPSQEPAPAAADQLARCEAQTTAGTQCKNDALPGSRYCGLPAHQAQASAPAPPAE